MAPSLPPGAFEWHSSSIDWCEENYQVVGYIAEFFNTITNIPFVVGPCVSMWLMRDYWRRRGTGLLWMLVLVQVIGVGSAYFHTTLSFAGQVVDELAILWLLAYGLALCLPPRYYQKLGIQTQTTWHVCVALVTLVASLAPYYLGRDFSVLVAPLLIAGGLPLTVIAYDQTVLLGNIVPSMCWWLFYRALTQLGLGVVCWVIDRTLCTTIIKETHFQLHALWHVFIYMFASDFITFLCYVMVFLWDGNNPALRPALRFLPSQEIPLFPYVTLHKVQQKKKE